MRKLYLLIFCCLLLIANVRSQELTEQQPGSKIDLFFSAGTALPSNPSDFTDYWNMGFAFGGGVEYSLTDAFTLAGSIDYYMFPLDEDEILKSVSAPPGVTTSGGGISVFTVMANVKAKLNPTPNIVAPYVTAGIGFFNIALDDLTVTYQGQSQTGGTDSKSAFTFAIGAGIEIPVGPQLLFIEGKYCIGFTEGDNTGFIPIRAGMKIRI